MIIEPVYRHEEPGRISYVQQKAAADDELYIRIIPAEGEKNPFGDNIFPFARLVDIVDSLNALGVEINGEEVVADAE